MSQTLPSSPFKSQVLAEIQQLRQNLTNQLQQLPILTGAETAQVRLLDSHFQQEVGKLVALLQRLERLVHRTPDSRDRRLHQLLNLVESVAIAVLSLTHSRSRIEVSRQIRFAVEQQIISYENPPGLRLIVRRFAYAWHSPSTPLKVIHGLIFSFFIIFGGLFTLAIFQYSISRSHAAVSNYSSLKEQLNKQILETDIKLKNLEQTSADAVNNIAERKDRGIPRKEKEIQALETQISAINPNELIGQQERASLVNQRIQAQKELDVLTKELSNYRRQRATADASKGQVRAEQQRLQQSLDQVTIDSRPTAIQKFLAQLFDNDISQILSQILWVAAAGTLGSIVSILIRVIDQFNGKEYKDRLTPFFLGFFKPVIGAAFGVLFLAIYNSEIVSLPFANRVNQTIALTPPNPPNAAAGTPPNGTPTLTGTGDTAIARWTQLEQRANTQARQEIFFLFAIAFVVGFSERLAKDTISKIDGSAADGSSSGSGSSKLTGTREVAGTNPAIEIISTRQPDSSSTNPTTNGVQSGDGTNPQTSSAQPSSTTD